MVASHAVDSHNNPIHILLRSRNRTSDRPGSVVEFGSDRVAHDATADRTWPSNSMVRSVGMRVQWDGQLTCARARREGDVVGEELAILHHKVGVGGRVIKVPVHDGAQDARVGERVARDRDARGRLAVRVVGRQEARETCVRLAPARVLQVVAAAVRVTKGEAGVADDQLILLAARDRVARLAGVQVDARQQLHWLRARGLELIQLAIGVRGAVALVPHVRSGRC